MTVRVANQIGTTVRSKLMSLITVIGAVTVLVLAANTVALATTGKAILAGKINTSSKMTSLVRTTPGSALQVKTSSAANAPFAVNGKGKVVNLNVDKVDGLDGGTRSLTWTYTGTAPGYRGFRLSGLPVGSFLITWDVNMYSEQIPNGSWADCYLTAGPAGGNGRYSGEDSGVIGSYGLTLSSTGYVTRAANEVVDLTCRNVSAGSWTVSSEQPLRINAIPLAGVTNKGAPLDPATIRTAAKR